MIFIIWDFKDAVAMSFCHLFTVYEWQDGLHITERMDLLGVKGCLQTRGYTLTPPVVPK